MNILRSVRALRGSQILAIILAISAALWIASGVVTGTAPKSKTSEKSVTEGAGGMRLVRVRSIVAEPFQSELLLYGRTEAVTYADLAAETSGRIVRRDVEKGAWAEKGTPLIQLAIEDREVQLNEAKTLVKYQTIAYNAAKRLSQKQFQTRVRLAQAEANLAKAKAALASIKLDIQRTTIRAPISGYIESFAVNVGDYVKVGKVIASLVDLNPISVVAQVSERDVTRLQPNGEALAILPDGSSLSGNIRYISKAGDSETRTFRVEIWIDNPNGKVPEGLTAELKIPVGTESAHRVSPAVLTLDDNGVIGVKAVDGGGRVVFHPTKILGDTSEGIWLGGLPERLTLISVGQEFVKVGQQVRIKYEAHLEPVVSVVSG